MPWGRLNDALNDDAKLSALSDGAFRLWVCGLVYCQRNLSDGFIPEAEVQYFRIQAKKRAPLVAELLTAHERIGKGPLWHKVDGGYQVHDYLQWNESRQQVERKRQTAEQRMALFQNPELRGQIRARDGDRCRYCGRIVRWNDRKGDLGGTYDHVQPYGGNDVANLVVCCRGCNAGKRNRTPEEAGLQLLDPPREKPKLVSRSDLDISRSEFEIELGFNQATTTTYQKNEKQERAAPPLVIDTDRVNRLDARIRQHRRRRSRETDDGRPAESVIAALARDVLKRHPDETDDGELRELLKQACARANLKHDGQSVGNALEVAKAQVRKAIG